MHPQLRGAMMLGFAFCAVAQSNVPAMAAGVDLACCGVCKPKATGPTNCCYGYYPTCWRTWPAECGPCAPPTTVSEVPPSAVVSPPPPEPEKVIQASQKSSRPPAAPKAIVLAV